MIDTDLATIELMNRVCGTRHGGHLADMPWPRIRRWPMDTTRPRTVDVRVDSWRGMSIGARHYYLTITEEHNYLLVEKDGEVRWVKPWDDTEGKGFEIDRLAFEREDDAYAVGKFIIKRMFSTSAHKVSWEGERRRKYIKRVDGD